jgi:hypothetical protein
LSFLLQQQVNLSDRVYLKKLLQGISVYFEFKPKSQDDTQDDGLMESYPALLGKIVFCLHHFHVMMADYYKTNLISTSLTKLACNDVAAWNLVLNCFYQVHLTYPDRFSRLSCPLKRYLLTLLEKVINMANPNLIKFTPIMLCNPMLNNTYFRYWNTAFIPAFNKLLENTPEFSLEDSALFYLGFNQGRNEFFANLKNNSKVKS